MKIECDELLVICDNCGHAIHVKELDNNLIKLNNKNDKLISMMAAIDAVCMEWCNVKHQNCEHPFDIEKDDYYWCDGCETALQTLPSLPSVQPKPDEWCTDCKEYDPEKHCCPRFNRVIRNALKDAQPKKKKGKWIVHPEVKNVYGGTYIECSQCGEKYVVQHMEDEKYCRNCGAKMEE